MKPITPHRMIRIDNSLSVTNWKKTDWKFQLAFWQDSSVPTYSFINILPSRDRIKLNQFCRRFSEIHYTCAGRRPPGVDQQLGMSTGCPQQVDVSALNDVPCHDCNCEIMKKWSNKMMGIMVHTVWVVIMKKKLFVHSFQCSR